MPRKHKKRKKHYTDEETVDAKDIEMREGDEYSDESSEEEVIKIYENRKQRAKRVTKETVQQLKSEPKCRTICFRYFLFIIVLSVGVAMVVQLYSTYGDYVTDAIFPPRTSSAGLVCANGTITNDYMLKWYEFEEAENETGAGWATLNATKPKDYLSMAWAPTVLVPTRWRNGNQLQVWIPRNECVSVLVYSV